MLPRRYRITPRSDTPPPLSAFMTLLGLTSWLINGGQPASGQPDWYPWVMTLLVPPTAVLGGILVTWRTRSRTYFSKRARETE